MESIKLPGNYKGIKHRETVYLTVSDDVMDTLFKTSKGKSDYRDSLTDRVVFDQWGLSGTYERPDNYVYRNEQQNDDLVASRDEWTKSFYDNWGMDKVFFIDHQWQKIGYDLGFPTHYPAESTFGTNSEFASYVTTSKNAGWLLALHEDFWISQENAS